MGQPPGALNTQEFYPNIRSRQPRTLAVALDVAVDLDLNLDSSLS